MQPPPVPQSKFKPQPKPKPKQIDEPLYGAADESFGSHDGFDEMADGDQGVDLELIMSQRPAADDDDDDEFGDDSFADIAPSQLARAEEQFFSDKQKEQTSSLDHASNVEPAHRSSSSPAGSTSKQPTAAAQTSRHTAESKALNSRDQNRMPAPAVQPSKSPQSAANGATRPHNASPSSGGQSGQNGQGAQKGRFVSKAGVVSPKRSPSIPLA